MNDAPTDLILFVYGTLKHGCRSHSRLLHSPFVGEAWTQPCYRMYDCGSYPALVLIDKDPVSERAGTGESVSGELYRVNSKLIAVLDEFEHSYQRMPVQLVGPVAEAWAYIYLGDVSALPPCGQVWIDP